MEWALGFPASNGIPPQKVYWVRAPPRRWGKLSPEKGGGNEMCSRLAERNGEKNGRQWCSKLGFLMERFFGRDVKGGVR